MLIWIFPDLGRRYLLTLQNCALTYLADREGERPDATITLARRVLDRLVLRELTMEQALAQGAATIAGDPQPVIRLFGLLDEFPLMLDVIEPRR